MVIRNTLWIILISLLPVIAVASDVTVTFRDKFFLRTTPSFSVRDTSNAAGVVRQDNSAVLVDKKQTTEGNWALKIKISDGPHRGKSYWIYYDNNDPGITLSKDGKNISPSGTSLSSLKKVNLKVDSSPSADSILQSNGKDVEGRNCTECSVPRRKEIASDEISELAGAISETYSSVFRGALKTMAVMYQSCTAIEKKPYPLTSNVNIDKYLSFRASSSSLGHGFKVRTIPQQNLQALVKTHYYLNQSGPENSQCKDMRKLPPLYTYGGKPAVSKTEINLLIKQPASSGASYSGLDCSTFVSTALTAAGLRIKPGQPVKENRATSTQMSNFTEKNSCFKYPSFTADNSIQPGDIFAFSGHTFMIDTVGKDPWGFGKMKAAGIRMKTQKDCYNLPDDADENFDFRIIQSAGMGSLAISRTEAKAYITKANLLGYLEPYMISACIAKVTGNKVEQPKNQKAVFLRHRGTEVPSCTIPKNQIPHLTGEECVKSCTT